MCSGAVTKQSHLIACRVFLGIFEASFGAGAYVNPSSPLHSSWQPTRAKDADLICQTILPVSLLSTARTGFQSLIPTGNGTLGQLLCWRAGIRYHSHQTLDRIMALPIHHRKGLLQSYSHLSSTSSFQTHLNQPSSSMKQLKISLSSACKQGTTPRSPVSTGNNSLPELQTIAISFTP